MEITRLKPSVSIILPTYNKLDYAKLCLASLYAHTSQINFELITVNNGSTDGTEEFFKSLPNKKKISLSMNCGMPKAFNEGLKLAEGEFTVFLSNDIVLTPNWLDNLLKCAQSDEKIGMVAPACNFASYFQQLNLAYNNQEELVLVAKKYNRSDPRKWEERIRLINYASLMRTRLLKELGGFDEIYSPYLFEDDDLSFRMRRAGYKLILTRDTYIHHFGAITQKEHYASKNLLVRNRRIFSARFGVDSWDDTAIDQEILDCVDYNRTKDVHILGIDSRCGGTVLQIKNRFRENGITDVWLWSLTEDEKYLRDLQTIGIATVCESPDNIAALFQDQKFDCIVIESDLRTIANPEGFLKRIKGILKEDGRIIFTVANELFYANIMNLLNGSLHSGNDSMISHHLNLDKLTNYLAQNGFEQLKLTFSRINPPPEHAIFLESLSNLKNLTQPESSESTGQIFSTKRFIVTAQGLKTYKNIFFYTGYDYLQNNMVFEDKSFLNSLGVDTGENCLWVLREEFARFGYKISTLDNHSDIEEAEYILFQDVPKYYGNHCFLGMYQYVYKGKIYFEEYLKRKSQGKTKAKLAVILNEPPFVMSENYDQSILEHFDLVFTYDDDLVDNKKYFKCYIPQPEDVENPYARAYPVKKLCTFVGANKSSLLQGELYTERRNAIIFFENNHSEDFDFYGRSWEGSGFICYKGPVDNKLDVLSQYKFCICYENGSLNGWISEKIFDSFFAGCVPIYLGAPNISDYIPHGTFIDKRNFEDYGQLYEFISKMNEAEYNKYLNNITEFLKSDAFKKFTRRSFAQNIAKVLIESYSKA